MNRLQLATILSWAGESGVQGRKRLQKVIYFLQQAGCNLNCAYTLHHFGPYSRDVADACDEMVAARLIDETTSSQDWGIQYSYKLAPGTQALLDRAADQSMDPYRTLATTLISQDLWQLELGSTIHFFYGQTGDWERALEEACAFKKVSASDDRSQKALALARRVLEYTGN
ncbi:MAG: hypothetical protein KF886_04775 [Candidatus Hydrogenedentes bacterium]|nr:hypothetical protein [Candidatus Hydrogenedentota bacterium]